MNTLSRFFLLLLLVVSLTGCSEKRKLKNILVDYQTVQNEHFSNWVNPGPMLAINSSDSIRIYIDFLKSFEDKLLALDSTKLEPTSLEIWQNEVFVLKEQQQYWENFFQDPSAFDVTGHFKDLLFNSSDTLKNLRQISSALGMVPEHFERAKEVLVQPDPDRSSIAVQKQLLFLRFLQVELPDILDNVKMPAEELKELESKAQDAKMASKDFIGFCESLIFEHFDTLMTRPPVE